MPFQFLTGFSETFGGIRNVFGYFRITIKSPQSIQLFDDLAPEEESLSFSRMIV
jgi:hypothetical protein